MNLKRIFMTLSVTAVTAISIAFSAKAYLKGDANGDGVLNIRDAAYIAACYSQGKTELLSEDGDFNGDGVVNIRDASAILKHIALTTPVVTAKAPVKTTTKAPASKTVVIVKTTTAKAAKGYRSIVYITKTGKKYHYSSTCNGGTYYPCKYEDAIKKGLKPCKKCVL